MNILIIGMAGFGNLGDDLIAHYLIKKIKIRYPGSNISVLIGEEGSILLSNDDSIVLLSRPKLSHFVRRLKFQRKIFEICKCLDILFIGGGGLFQDSHSNFTVHRYLKYLKYAKSNTHIVGVGLGVGPINSKFTEHYIFRYLKYFTHIQLRDKYSEFLLEDAEVSRSIAPDIVLGSDINDLFESPVDSDYIGASIRPTPNLDINFVVGELTNLYNDYRQKLILFVFEDKIESHIELDFNIKLLELLKSKNVECEISNFRTDCDFYKKFSSVKYALASRYHANILWQKTNTFVKPIAYAPKVESLYLENDQIDEKSGYIKLKVESNYELPNNFPNYRREIGKYSKSLLWIYSVLELFYLIYQKMINKNLVYGFKG